MSVTDTLLAVPCCQGGAGRYHTLHRFAAEREREDNASALHAHTYKHRWTAKTQGDMLPYTDFLAPTDQSPSHQSLLPSTHLLPPPSLTYHQPFSPSHQSFRPSPTTQPHPTSPTPHPSLIPPSPHSALPSLTLLANRLSDSRASLLCFMVVRML